MADVIDFEITDSEGFTVDSAIQTLEAIDYAARIITLNSSITNCYSFHQLLRNIEASEEGVLYPIIHTFKVTQLGSGATFPAIAFINGWTLQFTEGVFELSGGNYDIQINPTANCFVKIVQALAYAVSNINYVHRLPVKVNLSGQMQTGNSSLYLINNSNKEITVNGDLNTSELNLDQTIINGKLLTGNIMSTNPSMAITISNRLIEFFYASGNIKTNENNFSGLLERNCIISSNLSTSESKVNTNLYNSKIITATLITPAGNFNTQVYKKYFITGLNNLPDNSFTGLLRIASSISGNLTTSTGSISAIQPEIIKGNIQTDSILMSAKLGALITSNLSTNNFEILIKRNNLITANLLTNSSYLALRKLTELANNIIIPKLNIAMRSKYSSYGSLKSNKFTLDLKQDTTFKNNITLPNSKLNALLKHTIINNYYSINDIEITESIPIINLLNTAITNAITTNLKTNTISINQSIVIAPLGTKLIIGNLNQVSYLNGLIKQYSAGTKVSRGILQINPIILATSLAVDTVSYAYGNIQTTPLIIRNIVDPTNYKKYLIGNLTNTTNIAIDMFNYSEEVLVADNIFTVPKEDIIHVLATDDIIRITQ